jgi:hypothetical protein
MSTGKYLYFVNGVQRGLVDADCAAEALAAATLLVGPTGLTVKVWQLSSKQALEKMEGKSIDA